MANIVTIRRIVPKSMQISIKANSEEILPLKLVTGDLIEIVVKKQRVVA